jgi:hypothetical protein
LQDIAEVVIFILSLFAGLEASFKQNLHDQPCQAHISLEALTNCPVMPLDAVLFGAVLLLDKLLIIIFEIRQDNPQGPVNLIYLQLPQRSRFLMGMQKVDEIDDLQYHLCNLKVIQDHIVVHHQLEGSMMIVKDEIVRITFDLLLCTHIGWNLSFDSSPVFERDSIEANQICT